jgi:Ca2+-binding EF-hand superfamily protein
MGDNFLKQYGDCHTISIVDFMQIWKNYDSDKSGFIETEKNEEGSSEFKRFIVDLMELMLDEKIGEEEIEAITKHFLEEYDANKDGKFAISELIQIFPVEENFLQQFIQSSDVSNLDIDQVFEHYDKDKSGKIQEDELNKLVKDLMSKKSGEGEEVTQAEIDDYKQQLLAIADKDGDGQISKDELILLVKLYLKK